MKNRLAFKAGGEADIHHLGVAGKKQFGGLAHSLAAKPLGRRQMGMKPEQGAQLGLADAGGLGQSGSIGEIMRRGPHPLRQAFEQSRVLVLAPVIKVGTAALAGAQARRLAFRLGAEKRDVFRFGRMGGTGRQAVNPRGAHADQELAVEFAAAGDLAGPGKGLGKFHGKNLAQPDRPRLLISRFGYWDRRSQRKRAALASGPDSKVLAEVIRRP